MRSKHLRILDWSINNYTNLLIAETDSGFGVYTYEPAFTNLKLVQGFFKTVYEAVDVTQSIINDFNYEE
jgi:hypothetical protein